MRIFRESKNIFRRFIAGSIISFFAISCILPPQISFAQITPLGVEMPAPGTMVHLTSAFTPPLLRGLTIHPENPFDFDFIFTDGDKRLSNEVLQKDFEKMVRYFLAALTIPEKDLWVNLSPYEKDRIIPDEFAQTEMGRDLLAQDYILKQLTASLIYPEEELGQEFWSQVYEKLQKEFGTTDIPVNTFNKVWILPQKAVIYREDNKVFVSESSLKVLMEEDLATLDEEFEKKYFPIEANSTNRDVALKNKIPSDAVKRIVLPMIEKEVNEGRHFAPLRQIYQSIILAAWFKKNLKQSILSKQYVDQKKVNGVSLDDENVKEEIYQQYLDAYRKGVYSYIKEEYDQYKGKVIPKKYFSGGTVMAVELSVTTDSRNISRVLSEYTPYQLTGSVVTSKNGVIASSPINSPPQPYPNAKYHRGTQEPEFAFSELIVSYLLGLNKKERNNFTVNSLLNAKAVIFAPVWGNRIAKLSDQKLLEVLEVLRERRIISSSNDRPFEIGANQRIVFGEPESGSERFEAVWAHDTQFIKEDLRRALNNKRAGSFIKILEQYENIVSTFTRGPREAIDPVMRAVLLLEKDEQQKIVQELLKIHEVFVSDIAYTILLKFAKKEVIKQWAKDRAPYLQGRDIILVTPEFSPMKGGLGRVTLYDTSAMHELGVNVILVQPRYRRQRLKNGSLTNIDFAELPNKILNERKIEKTFKTVLSGATVEAEAWIGETEEGIPVISVRDIQGKRPNPIVDILYETATKDSPVLEDDFRIFFSKIAAEVIRFDQVAKKKRLKEKYKAPVIDLHDGQALPTAAWLKLFYWNKDRIQKDEGTSQEDIDSWVEILHESVINGTTHTYPNRGKIYDLEQGKHALMANGVPEEYLWLFLARDDAGKPYFDWSSAGLRASDTTKGVAEIHAAEVNSLDPGLHHIGHRNGDRLEYTEEYLRKILDQMGVMSLEDVTADQLDKAKRQAKKNLGLNPNQLVISYSGRGVPEKLDFDFGLIERMVKDGIQVLIYASEQPYTTSQELVRKLRRLEERLGKQGYPGKFILVSSFDINDQRKLLPATDVQIQFSTRKTEAAGYTEANVQRVGGLQMAQPFWEGIQARVGTLVNRVDGTGTILVPIGTGLDDYWEPIDWANKAFKDKSILKHQIEAIKVSAALDALFTAADHLEHYNDAFENAKRTILKPRLPGEVEIEEVKLIHYERKAAPEWLKREGNTFFINRTELEQDGPLLLETKINREVWDSLWLGMREVVPFDMITGKIVSEVGYEIPLERVSVEDSNGYITLVSEIPMDLKENFVGQVVVTSGLWEVTQDLRIEVNNLPTASSPINNNEKIGVENVGGILLDTAYINIEEQGHGLINPLLNSGFNFQGIDTLYWNTQYMVPITPGQVLNLFN